MQQDYESFGGNVPWNKSGAKGHAEQSKLTGQLDELIRIVGHQTRIDNIENRVR